MLQAARRTPERLAVETDGGSSTYAELDAAADLAARRVAALGIGPGERVAVTLGPSLAFAELLHAAPRVGAALVPLNTRLPEPARLRQVEAAGAALTIAEPLVNGFEAAIEPRAALDPDAVHTVLFTSGTTGEPKPVELTVRNQDAAAAASIAAFGIVPGDRWLCVLPLFHIAGLAILVRAARAGATAVLHDRFDTDRVLAALGAGEVTHVSLVATQLRRLREAGLERAPGLRAIVLGGGPIPPDLLEWARDLDLPVRATYGMTETCSQIVVTDPWEGAGRPLPGAEIEIGEEDEILVRGPMVAPGALAADGWLHTGDSGRLDRRGHLHVSGRLKDLIVTGGENVAPAAVEAVLVAHPAITDAAVVGEPDDEWGEAVVAHVVERKPVSDYELLAFCREHLAGYQVPKRVVRVTGLPRNAAGKLMRGELG